MAQQLSLGGRDSTPAISIRTPPPEDDEQQSGRAWAREVKDPWDPAILTLDGGGIRGYSSLLILQNLMHQIAEWERKLDKEEEAAKHDGPPAKRVAGENGNAVAGRIPSISPTEHGSPANKRLLDVQDEEKKYGITTARVQEDLERSQTLSVNSSTSSTASHDYTQKERQADTEVERDQDSDRSKVEQAERKNAASSQLPHSTNSRVPNSLPSANATLLPNGSMRPGIIEDELRPCHYFDFMYGTSTGGLIATLLGRLRLTVPQCLEIYREVGNDLFGTKRSVVPFATKYDHTPLEEAVRKIVQKHCVQHEDCKGEDWYPWNMEDHWDEPGPTDRICQRWVSLGAHRLVRVTKANEHQLETSPFIHSHPVGNRISNRARSKTALRSWACTIKPGALICRVRFILSPACYFLNRT